MEVIGFYVRGQKVKQINFDVDKAIIKAGTAFVIANSMTRTVYAGNITQSVQPMIDILKDLAEPVSYGFMIKGFMQIMGGSEHEGQKTIKYAIGGYIGIQWIPMIFKTIKQIQF